jgi:hypothetical protein
MRIPGSAHVAMIGIPGSSASAWSGGHYKVPRRIEFVDALPTCRGKVQFAPGAGSHPGSRATDRSRWLGSCCSRPVCKHCTGTAATSAAMPAIIDDAALSHAVVNARERFLARQPFDRFDVTVLRYDGTVRRRGSFGGSARVPREHGQARIPRGSGALVRGT